MFKKIILGLFLGLILVLGIIPVYAIENNIKNDEVINGLKVTYQNTGTGYAWFRTEPVIRDWSDATEVQIRIKNATSIDSPIQFSLHDQDGTIFATNQDNINGEDFVTLIDLDGQEIISKIYYGNVWLPANFDGVLSIPLDSFNYIQGNESLDLSRIFALFIGSDIRYNSFEKYYIGSISIKNTQSEINKVIDFTSLDDETFSQHVIKDQDENSLFVSLSRVLEEDMFNPIPAYRFGDFKLLESFEYTEEELLSYFPVWADGSEMGLSSYEFGYTGKAMKIDIGQPAPTQNYGSIDICPSPYISDWSTWTDNEGEYSKGISFWIKNLSYREITINIEFDEYNEGRIGPNGEDYSNERFNIKYGARILLVDKSGNEFIVQSKPTFSIPVGFEGFVRIPFTEFQVPEWCSWSDFTLDINKPISKIFITTDASVNQGLSFAIDSIGVYFNQTEANSLFHKSNNSIYNNMNEGEEK